MKAGTIVPVMIWVKKGKHFRNLLLIAALSGALIGCTTPQHGTTGTAHSGEAHHGRLELNGGKKWTVDKPMMAHIRNMEKAVQDFEKTSPTDHASLATGIQDNLGQLVTNCTMKGKAHDELHKWLMPFLGLSADYSKTTDPRVQQQKLHEIKQALLVFNEYFE